MSKVEIQGYEHRQRYWLFACVLLAIACISSFVLLNPTMPVDSLDPSWALGMSYGVDHGFKIGTDLVFTFGPLSNLYTGVYSEIFDSVYLSVSIYISLAMFFGIYGIFVDRKRFVPLALCAVMILFFGSRKDAFFMLVPAITSICLISGLLFSDSFSRRRLILVALCIPALGVLPMVKLSLSALCVFCLLINLLIVLYKRLYFWVVLYFALPALTFVGLWAACGQSFSDIPGYVSNARPIISGYTEAMAIQNGFVVPLIFLVGCLVLGKNLVQSKLSDKYLQLAVLLVVAAYLFIAFKAGFVRDDGHAVMSGIALIMIALLSWPFIQSLKGLGTVCASCFLGLVVIGVNTSLATNVIAESVYDKAKSFVGIKTRLLSSGSYSGDIKKRFIQISSISGFPKLEGSTDVYSYGQAALISSGVDWKPRPIFQSYSAYTPALIEKNAEHLRSAKGAQNIVFSVEPIDMRLPTLEDGASWPILFSQYKLTGLSGKYAVLKRNSESLEATSPISSNLVKLGESVNVPDFEGQVYMTAEVDQTISGRVRSLLFKPTQLMIRMVLNNGQTREYRTVSGMMKTEFLVSPTVENTTEFAYLFGGSEFLSSKKVKSVQVFSAKPNDWSWSNNVKVSFSGLKTIPDDSANKILGVAKLAPISSVHDGLCVGAVDSVNGAAPTTEPVKLNGFLQLAGWNSTTVDGFSDDLKNVVLLSSDRGFLAVNATPFERPDVGRHFNVASMAKSGFSTIVDVRGLSGAFKLGIAIEKNGEILRCPQYSYDVVL